MVVSYTVWAFAFSFEVFLIARIIGGICHSNVSLSTAIIADVTPPKSKQRARGMVRLLCDVFSVFGIDLLRRGEEKVVR